MSRLMHIKYPHYILREIWEEDALFWKRTIEQPDLGATFNLQTTSCLPSEDCDCSEGCSIVCDNFRIYKINGKLFNNWEMPIADCRIYQSFTHIIPTTTDLITGGVIPGEGGDPPDYLRLGKRIKDE